MQCLYAIRDYDRLRKEMQDILHDSPSHGHAGFDSTADKALRLEAISARCEAIDQALVIPDGWIQLHVNHWQTVSIPGDGGVALSLLKLCRCGAIIPQGQRGCPDCTTKQPAEVAARHRHYDTHRRNKTAATFYSSIPWRTIRAKISFIAFFDRDAYEMDVSRHAGFTKHTTLMKVVERYDVQKVDADAGRYIEITPGDVVIEDVLEDEE